MKTLLGAAAAVAIIASAAPAAAQTGNQDLRCLMLSAVFARAAPEAQAKQAAAQSQVFYLGRVTGKIAPAQLSAMMTAESRTIVPSKAGPEMGKCVAALQASVASVEAAGKKAQAASAPPAAAAPRR